MSKIRLNEPVLDNIILGETEYEGKIIEYKYDIPFQLSNYYIEDGTIYKDGE